MSAVFKEVSRKFHECFKDDSDKFQIDKFFFIDLKTTDKLIKNTAGFEVNRTSFCREIII